MGAMGSPWQDFLIRLGYTAIGALVVIVVIAVAMRLAARRWATARQLADSIRWPFRTLVVVVGVWLTVRTDLPGGTDNDAWGLLNVTLRILTIICAAWVVGAIVLLLEDQSLKRYRTDVPDNRVARRMRTQVLVIRRLTLAAIVVVAIGAVLLSFPGVETVGASVLASAGVLSVIAALAAQSTLGNVIAGIQIAFSDSVRFDDAVIVEGEWGWVEEITLSYVVVRLWDDRRMVLPSTYFTTTPFQNWTRNHSELLGAIEFDLDFRTDLAAMREELDRILDATELWDGRVKVLQATDATGGFVRVRVLASAHDAPTLFDLRCLVRERLIDWMQRHNEGALPRTRIEGVQRARPAKSSDTESPGLFSGAPEAEERAAAVTGQLPVIDAPLRGEDEEEKP